MPMASEKKPQPSELRKEARQGLQLLLELLMAARDGDSARLNNLLGNNVEEAKLPAVQQHSELLMAAREGSSARLNDLLAGEPPVAWTAIDIEETDISVSAAEAVTIGLDSILHVVASSGDNDEFLESASVIHSKARHLLDAGNGKGDTPLHCAARAGMINMVSQLIHLARAEGGDARVKAVLRKQNKQHETALHEALRLAEKKTVDAMVDKLMSADAQLARFPRAGGTSPLYLAVSLRHDDIAKQLHAKDEGLSYCGPNGQNALHAAVLKSTGMTNRLLKWDKDLSKQGDQPRGSTPMHFAASYGFHGMVMSLINADKSSAFQSDNSGSLPIHVAANVNVVRVLLEKCPDCAELRDAQGRTFLHVAVNNRNSILVWLVFVFFRGHRQVPRFATIMNMQDNEGNTGLHLAVRSRSLPTLYCLLWNKEVQLNLPNNQGQTPLDLSEKPTGSYLEPRLMIRSLLRAAGAEYGNHQNHAPDQLDEKKEAKIVSDSIQTIGIISALLVTISFAAAFTIPGGYRADDGPKAGMPVLASSYTFETFIVANNLALLCSALATISLGYSGVTNIDTRTRVNAFDVSLFFLHGSARSLAAAFAFGTYAALARVARATAVATWLGMAISFLDVAWLVCTLALVQLVLINRHGIRACLRLAVAILAISMWALWPYVIILGFLAYYKTHGFH